MTTVHYCDKLTPVAVFGGAPMNGRPFPVLKVALKNWSPLFASEETEKIKSKKILKECCTY
jgi:hypothetical protein